MGKKRRWRETITLIRLHIIAEGQAEEGFVNEILAPELGEQNVFADVHRITTGRRRGRSFRGGFTNYDHFARDIELWMKQDQHEESWFTTMVDYYRLPDNCPGYEEILSIPDVHDRVAHLEAKLADDIVNRLNGIPVSKRFVPYIQLHEFEALLFSEPGAFLEAFPGGQKAVDELSKIRGQFDTPEEIDTDESPSGRILSLLPDYQKPVAGPIISRRIGLATIRQECPRFATWIARLAMLGGGSV